MAQSCDSPKTFLAAEVLAAYRRVKLSSGSGTYVVYADQADSSSFLGITIGEAAAIGDPVPVELKGVTRTVKATAADSFAAGAILYAANDGKVSDSASGNAIGTALEAASNDGDVVEIILDGGAAAIGTLRAAMSQDDNAVYAVPLTDCRTWDNLAVNIPATAANDDLALITGTAGSAAPQIEGADFGGTTESKKTAFQFALPVEYVAGESITLRVKAKMKVVADTSCTLDANVYRQAAPTTDICATAAQSINSATATNKDFTITPTDCAPGDLLTVILTVAGTDAGNAAPDITAVLEKIEMLLDVKG